MPVHPVHRGPAQARISSHGPSPDLSPCPLHSPITPRAPRARNQALSPSAGGGSEVSISEAAALSRRSRAPQTSVLRHCCVSVLPSSRPSSLTPSSVLRCTGAAAAMISRRSSPQHHRRLEAPRQDLRPPLDPLEPPRHPPPLQRPLRALGEPARAHRVPFIFCLRSVRRQREEEQHSVQCNVGPAQHCTVQLQPVNLFFLGCLFIFL